jgi:hypothetical protein
MVFARWQSTIVDEAGNIQPNAQVRVQREVAGAPLATIYSDRDGASPLGNPMTADTEGFAAFHAAGGAYRITATKGGFSRVWRYVAIGTAQELDETDGSISLQQNVDAGYGLTFESETSAPPSAGAIRFNNADLSAATEAYVSVENLGGSDIEARLLELFDAARTVKDTFSIADPASNAQASWQIDGAALVGSPGDYVTLTISAHAGETSFTDNERVNFQPSRAGADGGDGEDGLFDGTETQVTARSGDLLPFQDVSDSNNPKRGTAQSVAETARVEIVFMPFDLVTDVETGDGAGGVFFRVPAWMSGFNITAVAAANGAAGTGTGTTTIQLRNVTQAADILSTPITIDSTETDSSTAAAAAVINASEDDLTTGDLIRVDVDAIPDGDAPVGLIVSITAERPAS